MAAEVFKLMGTIGVNTKDAEKGLDSVSQKGRQAEKDLSIGDKVSASFAKAEGASRALLGTLTLVSAAVGAATVVAVKNAGELEQNIGGSEAVYGKYAKNLQGIAKEAFAKMGLSTSDYLATANKMGSLFRGAGFDVKGSMDLTTQAMQRAADVASIMGIDTSWAMESIAGAAKGNFTMMDNLGVAMNDTTIQAFALSKGIDKSTQKMTSQEKIGLAMQMFLEKTAYAAGNYAKENDTFAGSWSTLAATWKNVSSELATNLLPALTQMFNGLSKFLQNDPVGTLKQKFEEYKPLIFAVSGAIIGALVPAIVSMAIAIGSAVISLAPFIAIGAAIGLLVYGIIQVVKNWGAIMTWFQGIINTVWTAITTAFTNAINWIKTSVTAAWTAITTAFTTALNWINTAWNTTWNAIVTVFQAIWAGFLAFLTVVIGIPLAIINTLLIQPLLAAWRLLWGLIFSVFTTVWNAIKAFLTPMMNSLKAIITSTLNAIKATFTTIWNAIKAVTSSVLNAIKATITTIWNAIKSVTSSVWNSIKSVISSVWSSIKSAVSSAVNSAKSIISSVWNTIKSITSSTWNAIKAAIEGPMNRAKSFIKGVVDAIKGFFKFNIKWPKIPMPHFSINPSGWQIGDLLKGKIPSLGIDWYAKGGIMTGPTAFGFNGTNLMVGGEAGNEAVLPLNRDTLGMIGEGIAGTMGGQDSALLQSLIAEVRQLREDQKHLAVIMDSGELVGAIKRPLDRALQDESLRRQRGLAT